LHYQQSLPTTQTQTQAQTEPSQAKPSETDAKGPKAMATRKPTHLMASIICRPMLTQLVACWGREMGKPDTQ